MNQTSVNVGVEPLTRDTACAKEPIHIPGGIQPHGYLVSLTCAGTVAQVSANLPEWSGMPAEALLGGPLLMAIGATAAHWVAACTGQLREGETRLLGTVPVPASARLPVPDADGSIWSVIMHRHAGIVIVELERARGGDDGLETIYPTVRAFLHDVQRTPSIVELGRLAAARIAGVTGFGRTLVYRFDHDGHGQVFAEFLEDGYASYLGQRFPASDIPAQARDLYRRNRIRLIADVDYAAVPLVPVHHPQTGAPTDLTLSSLRSVSPIHLQYMRNMGTAASMSMSIIVGDRLWGLISCHHANPRTPAFDARTACEQVAQILSLQIEASEAQSEATYRLDLRRTLGALLARMANTENFVDALASDAADLLGFTASAGAAIVFEGRITAVGSVPAEDEVWRLVDWLGAKAQDVVHSDAAPACCPWLGAHAGHAAGYAGFLAVSISKTFRNYVIWFRPEVIQTIEWAGDPRTKLASLADSLSPRESFDTWTDTVRDRSLPWRAAEVEIAREFRTALLGIVLRRAEELAQLTMALGRANRELEDFSYTVSHDLRAPLRHIHSFASLLQETDGETLSARSRDYVRRIVESADFGGRLVDDLLAFAQLGRAALAVSAVDMNALVRSIVQGEMTGQGAAVDWRVGALPTVHGDPAFLRMVMQNLIENALKFSAKRSAPCIEIGCLQEPEPGPGAGHHVLFVKDNGVGFDMRYIDKLFRVFQRLHGQEEFAGTGIGLANVKRIVERHGGQVRAESQPDRGATFFVSLPDEISLQGSEQPEAPAAALARLVATGTRTPATATATGLAKIVPRGRH
ncbi:ATP-binding protein [Robbsia sp. Bb-Pol-6]|uniref:histidine kinase n=1 Tax=Robbsia betulipollinis TaxID=2981849 RepID=A0ABT3ZI79_9BURK|nr:ATP-binding protein [Robbsia betulipollinis]MCY0386231.1 ATP-binding protein [Robbsia betulipollinis]